MDKYFLLVIVLVIVALLALLGIYIVFSPLEENKELGLKNCLVNLDSNKTALSVAQQKVISYQENDKYVVEQLRKTNLDLNKIREVYSALWGDAASCYWANACSKRPENCELAFGEPGAVYWANYYSEVCDSMNRDWEKYQSYDASLEE